MRRDYRSGALNVSLSASILGLFNLTFALGRCGPHRPGRIRAKMKKREKGVTKVNTSLRQLELRPGSSRAKGLMRLDYR
jgi:hypothetical protein